MDLKDKIERRRRERVEVEKSKAEALKLVEKSKTEAQKLDERIKLDLAIDTLCNPNPTFPSPISNTDAQYIVEKNAQDAVLPWSGFIVIVSIGCSIALWTQVDITVGLSLFAISSVVTIVLHMFLVSVTKKELIKARQAKRGKTAREQRSPNE